MSMLIFAPDASAVFATRVAAYLQVPLARHQEKEFEEGEFKIRPLENVRGRDVCVIHSLYAEPGQSVSDKLCRLVFFIATLRDASAGKITAAIPYLAFARQDRKSQPRDSLTLKYVARMLEAAGADQVVTMDVHNLAAYQNAFRIPAENLEPQTLFADYLAPLVAHAEVTIVSPDTGGIKRAQTFRDCLSARLKRTLNCVFIEKTRVEGKVTGGVLVGEITHHIAIVIDDIIGTGSTVGRALSTLKEHGATKIYVAASHGIFAGRAEEYLLHPSLEQLVITDSIPPFRLTASAVRAKLTVLSAAPLFGEAIRRMVEGGSVSALASEFPLTVEHHLD
jgi:ribose-phosphate pyrophosphokinase